MYIPIYHSTPSPKAETQIPKLTKELVAFGTTEKGSEFKPRPANSGVRV